MSGLVNSRRAREKQFSLTLRPAAAIISLIVSFLPQSEVTAINKQKFLAELSKLLTFMYEEDRQTALAMYGRMFDEADDEQALLLELVSPTRQAVIVARAYNSKERKLQVRAQSRSEDGADCAQEETPDFVRAIAQIHPVAAPSAPEIPADQLSLFGDAGDTAPAEEPTAAPEDAARPAAEPAAQSAAATPADDIDVFIANFSIADDALAPEAAPEDNEPVVLDLPDEPEDVVPADEAEDFAFPVARKPKVFLLILYIIIAAPVTLLTILLLLLPAALFLALAVAAIGTGAAALFSAFSGFAVFADIMVVLGAALVILALGLLFLWIFIWFIGGAIAGLVRDVIRLGGEWCYKEVPAE